MHLVLLVSCRASYLFGPFCHDALKLDHAFFVFNINVLTSFHLTEDWHSVSIAIIPIIHFQEHWKYHLLSAISEIKKMETFGYIPSLHFFQFQVRKTYL